MSGAVSKECIDFLTGKIKEIEHSVKERIKLRRSFIALQTIPGVVLILTSPF